MKEFCVGKTENCTKLYFEAKSRPKQCLDICTAKRNEGVKSSFEVKASKGIEGSAKAKIWHFTASSWCSLCKNGAWKQNMNCS